MKIKIFKFLKYIWQIMFSAAIISSIITYPLYMLLGIIVSILYITFSVWRVYRFISKTNTIGNLSKLSNIQISQDAFSWNVLSRLILLKVLNDYEIKKVEKDNGSENSVSCWDVLEVHSTATLSDVKKSYKKLAKLYHPDTTELDTVDAKIKFDKLTRCKNVLIEITKDK